MIGFVIVFSLIGGFIVSIVSKFSGSSKPSIKSTIESSKDKAAYYYNQARICYEKKDYRQAISYYDSAITYEQSSIYYNNRGYAKYQLKDFSGAIDDYSVAIRYSPSEADYYINRAFAFHLKGDNNSAYKDYEKAAALGSNYAKDMLINYRRERLIANTIQNEYSKKQGKIEKDLIGTEWHMKFFDIAIKECDIKFNSNGIVIFSDSPKKTDNFWSVIDNIITLKLTNGFATYSGIIENITFSGNASNLNGAKWRFQANLISKEDNLPMKSSLDNQKKVQLPQKLNVKSKALSFKIKRTNWTEFNKVLTDNNISTLYHFTDEANLQSIKKHGALYSWQYCETNNITIPQAGGGELSRSLDRRHGVQNYVRLSFIRNHPMMYLLQTRGRLGNTVVLEIDPVVVFWKDTKFANKNATRNDVNIGSTLDEFKRIRFNIIKRQNHFDLSEEEKPFYQAEVLVFEKIPIEFIENINDL